MLSAPRGLDCTYARTDPQRHAPKTSSPSQRITSTGILALWLVWSVGSFAGGLAGGVLLKKLGAMSGKIQKSVLRLAYLVAIAGALLPFLNWGKSITH